MPSEQVRMILAEIQAIHNKKQKDYAQEGNSFSNFERAAMLAQWFQDPVDKVFATLIGIKMARLAELLNGREPVNESTADSFLDENTYSVIWHAYYLEKRQKEKMRAVEKNYKENRLSMASDNQNEVLGYDPRR